MKGPAEVAHGPMFIGFIFNLILYGIMLTQIYLYFTTNKDKSWMKFFVVLLFICDTANTAFDFVYLYNSLIIHFGDSLYLAKADWVFATDPAITGITASLVQFFFAWRVGVLTHSWPLALVVYFGAVSGGIGAIATAFEVGRTPEFVYFRNFKGVVIMWLASASVTDIIITGILVWYLSHKTGFHQSDLMIDRIIRLTVQTGMITSLIATLDLILFLTDPTGTHLIFNFPLCKLYTNSLMSSLNTRRGWQFGTILPDLTTFQSNKTLYMLNASTLVNTPPNSPHSPTHLHSFPYFREEIVGERVHLSHRSTSSGLLPSVSKPTPAVRFKKNAPSEILVQVESHQTMDVYRSPIGPRSHRNSVALGENCHAQIACSPVETDFSVNTAGQGPDDDEVLDMPASGSQKV